MFFREIINEFRKWADSAERKPMVLRGARQVGKTTVVDMFANEFDQYIRLNLEKQEDKALFENPYPFQDLLTTLFLISGKVREGKRTLLFIDEIQNSAKAVALLRYFYEEAPDLYVITAGSLQESILDRRISFPVGRVEYRMLYPVSFKEFLFALGDDQSVQYFDADVIPAFLHDHFSGLFKRYSTIGGMPEIVDNYIRFKDMTRLQVLYSNLLKSYSEDIEKYAPELVVMNHLRHIISVAFTEPCSRVTFENFGNSGYRYRDVKEAFSVLERTLLISLVYPGTETVLPSLPKLRMKPRLHLLDTGLVNFASGMTSQLLQSSDISDVYRGKIAEHIVGQELLAASFSFTEKLRFWVREKKQSTAEVDYIYGHKGMLIPVEVKSGSIGKLRSLHQFMDVANHGLAVRIWQGPFLVEKAKTISGKEFTLLNLPFYMVHRIDREIGKLLS
jgi:uncharacterized protein